MEILAHRGFWTETPQKSPSPGAQNSLLAIERAFQNGWGVETDIRSFGGALFLSHDTVTAEGAPRFEALLELLTAFPDRLCFLNVKEDGLLRWLEPHFSKLENTRAVFFDYSVPELFQYSKKFPRHQLATRFSDLEPVPAAAERCEWIWVDGFTRDPDGAALTRLSTAYSGHKLAVVSPELHRRDPAALWGLMKERRDVAALCTDHPQVVQDLLAH